MGRETVYNTEDTAIAFDWQLNDLGQDFIYLRHPWARFTTMVNFKTRISNCIHYKMWDEITYLFPNFNGCTVEIWE